MEHTPEYVKQIVKRNRELWKSAATDPEKYRADRAVWEKEIHTRLARLRGPATKKPLVSIVLPARNEEEHLLATLEGISRQEGVEGLEVLVVANNCAPDDETALIAANCGARVIEYWYRNTKEQPIALARQQGLIFSNGSYYISTDADSIAMPHWVEKLIKGLADEGVGFSTSHSRLYEWEEDKKVKDNDHQRVFMRDMFEWTGFIGLGNNMAFRRDEGVELTGYNAGIYPSEDTEFGVRLTLFQQKKAQLVKDSDASVWLSPRRVRMLGGDFILNDWLFTYRDKKGDAIDVRESYKRFFTGTEEKPLIITKLPTEKDQ